MKKKNKKKKDSGAQPMSPNINNSDITVYGSANSSDTLYIPTIAVSGAIYTGGYAGGNISIGNQDSKTYLEGDTYLKIKIKGGIEVEIKLTDYIKYPIRMGKELEDSTQEEYNEWKMVNEL